MTFDMKCPFCGEWNKNLYLEETDGSMECEYCNEVSRRDYRMSGTDCVRVSRSYHNRRKVIMLQNAV
ncbi:MAG: hypothetical protein MJ116_03125 [Lachnospiraceae bacterium]|nr:hypothetical protein [Lachnospiraceae bacterium]